MEKREKPPSEPGKWRQFLAVMVVNLSTMTYGLMVGWQSPYGPQLQSSSSPVGNEPMTDEAVSWLSGITCLAGGLVTGLLSVIPDKYSRKRFGYLLTLPMVISWVLIIFATEHIHIYIARFLHGVVGAGTFFFVPVYVSEISNDNIRGLLGSLLMFAINFGILLGYVLGGMFSLSVFAIINLAGPVLFLVTFAFMPESPVYLVRQNRIREAARSLKWLKDGDGLVAERTLSYIQANMKQADTATRSVKLSDLFRDRATIKGLIIVTGLFICQQFCGIFAMITYTETIFEASGSSLSPNAASVVIGTIQLFGACLASSLMERAGRRSLLLISCVGMCLCHCVIGGYCYFQEFGYNVTAYGWVPVTALSVFMIVYCLGMGAAPIIVTTEIFSRDVTSLATTIGLCCLWLAAFVIVKVFAQLIALLGMYGCFFLLALCCALSFIFCFALLPETKGRIREDIVDELNGKRCTKSEKDAKHIIGMDSEHAAHV
ncbi:PREDICTED: facilitated trehalose transporter Tret1-2 homolog [Dinoponera quadriceps]|uniref:Facilitated trehalose transporter Tret1-2 homolog n=1 Tax=Dinoponera quadriceps TaxID=609295 RepID=A0A6P3XY04_DINQU|nr:PREDICTED: facilitated trehalose transporter Tret1-2 homolog [Dinoponera quadriceps]